jgi:hypothetical protein
MTDHRSNRNEQRWARALQQSRGISYMQALEEVRGVSQEADGPSVELTEPIRQVPAEYRFVVSVVEDLRRHGRAGAAQSVLRSRAADFFQDRSSLRHDLGDLIRLASYGVRCWGMNGLHQIEEPQLAELAEPWLPLASGEGAGVLEQVIGGWRATLRSRTAPSPPRLPVRRESMLDTLGQLQLGVRAIGALSDARDWTPASVQSAARAADNLGRALSRAFGGGIVTALPPAVDDALHAIRDR